MQPWLGLTITSLFVYSWCFQPSIYLRLLENPSWVAPQASFLCNATSPLSESSGGRSPSPPRSESPPCSPSPPVSQQPPLEHTSLAPTGSHAPPPLDPSSDRSMQQVILVHVSSPLICFTSRGVRADLSRVPSPLHSSFLFVQKLSSREFSRRSVKERAVLLSTMFTGFTQPHLGSCQSQVLCCVVPIGENQHVLVKLVFIHMVFGRSFCHLFLILTTFSHPL